MITCPYNCKAFRAIGSGHCEHTDKIRQMPLPAVEAIETQKSADDVELPAFTLDGGILVNSMKQRSLF